MYVYVPQPQASKLYNADMLMMMMMSGFVERVINSPQTRYRSAKQVTFRCRANVSGERVAARRAAGKLFQMTGPTTAKLLMYGDWV